MSLTYRTRRNLKRWGIALLIIALVLVIGFTLWVVWADRYIVYTREGAILDMSLSATFPEATPAEPPDRGPEVPVVVHDPQTQNDSTAQLTSISGYYITLDELSEDIPGVIEQVKKLPGGTAVMVDMKNIKGYFLYESSLGGKQYGGIDAEQMDELLKVLATQNLHTIARIPAFRDWDFGLNNVPLGLARKGGGGALWMDDAGCYWLDPTKQEVLNYVITITMELKNLGFDEVAYTDFRFPETTKVKFDEDQDQAISDAATQIAKVCAKDGFFVSFEASKHAYALPMGNCRLYFKDVEAVGIAQALQDHPIANPAIQALFITETNDTRYNDYCVLRPLEDALQTTPTEE